MGNNLSSSVNLVVDTTLDVFAPEDQFNDIVLGVVWASVVYIIFAIWCFFTLLGRWVEENSDCQRIDFGTVASRLMLSLVWPVTLLYISVSGAMNDKRQTPASYMRKSPA